MGLSQELIDFAVDNNLEDKCKKLGRKAEAEASFVSTNVCRLFASTGKCKFGDKCKYAHKENKESEKKAPDRTDGKKEEKSKQPEKKVEEVAKSSFSCHRCGKAGHVRKDCKVKIAAPVVEGDEGSTSESNEESELSAAVFCLNSEEQPANKKRKDQWGLDSCASRVMTNNLDDFEPGSIVEVDVDMQVGDSNSMKITKKGIIRVKQGEEGKLVKLSDAYYAPLLPIKLISLGVLIKAGFDFCTDGVNGTVTKEGKKAFVASLKHGIWIIRGLKVIRKESCAIG